MTRTSWLDEGTDLPVLEQKVQELKTFTDTLVDGKVDAEELDAQLGRLVEAMKAVEPHLDDTMHAKVTRLLVELTAYDIMRTLHELQAERLRRKFS